MPPPPFKPTLLFLLLLSATASSAAGDDLTAELQHLQLQSPTGLIRLTDDLLGRILALPRPRPFSLIVFFDAAHLHDKHELQLPTLKSEFSIVASSFIQNNKDTLDAAKLFFFDIEFKDSQRSFSLFEVNSLPHVRFISPHVKNLKDSDPMTQSGLSGLAESVSEFIESKAKISVGPIHRPPLLSGKQIAFILVVLMIWAPFALKKIISGTTLLHDYKFWLFGGIFVYFFSVSGTMHNIIRQMPLFIPDRSDPTKLMFFYQGSGMQLGAEGFAVGFLYTIVGLLLGFITHGLVQVRDLRVQRVLMILALIIGFWAVRKVVYLDNWKTGYGIHAYWPSSWH